YSWSFRCFWPCCPGGYFRRSMAHLLVKQRSPFRNSLTMSRRQSRQTGPLYTAIRLLPPGLDPAPLGWPAAVVRDRGHVLDHVHFQPDRLERPDRRLAARAGPLDVDVHPLEAMLHRLARRVLGRHLRSEGRPLLRTFESHRPGARPAEHVALLIGDRDDRIVE